MLRWTVVLPVKRLAVAKTRLGRLATPELALAFARDTAAAALACPAVAGVLVVTPDRDAATRLAELGAHVVPDEPDAGLNAAVQYGATLAPRGPLAALAGDLPALRPAELAAALTAAAVSERCFVADAHGSGTVLLAAAAGVRLDPRFGPASAAAHRASGATPLAGDWPSLRRDVDTAADLAAARLLGLGRYTTEALG